MSEKLRSDSEETKNKSEVLDNKYELNSSKINLDIELEKDEFNEIVSAEIRAEEKRQASDAIEKAFEEAQKFESASQFSGAMQQANKEERQVGVNMATAEPKGPSGKKHRSLIGKISYAYDVRERARVDEFRNRIDRGGIFVINKYEAAQISTRPSALNKLMRLTADKLGIKTKLSEDSRDREAMHVALTEYYEHIFEMSKKAEEKRLADEEKKRQEVIRAEEDRIRREEEELLKDMIGAREYFDRHKHEKFEKQRIQEMVERDLNKSLLTIDKLEEGLALNDSGVEKRLLSFDNNDIVVYDLKGLPFSVLSTTIDYKRSGYPGRIGTETFKNLMENPAIWAERRDEAERSSGFGTSNANARGDTISMSYWDSERNIHTHVPGELIYGFDHVEADSIITIVNGDGGTGNMAGKSETILSNPNIIDKLEGPQSTLHYNEVLLRRYMENGMPKKPDYIIVENGKISDVALKHASYFDVPIVNIDRLAYDEKARKRGEAIINSISKEDSYQDLLSKTADLLSMSRYKVAFKRLTEIGLRDSSPSPNSQLKKEGLRISKMEQLKRLDFIKDQLEEMTKKSSQLMKKELVYYLMILLSLSFSKSMLRIFKTKLGFLHSIKKI